MGIERIQPEGVMELPGLAQVVVATGSRMVFLSGQTPQEADGTLVGPGDLAKQAKKVFENLKTSLEAAGATPDDIVKTTIFIVDYQPEHLQQLYPPIYEVFGEDMKAATSTLVGVQALYMPGQLIEVEAIAVVD